MLRRLLRAPPLFLLLVAVGLGCSIGSLRWPQDHARRRVWRDRVLNGLSRPILSTLNVRLQVVGEPPKPPFLLVSNHLSYLDVPVLLAAVGAVFVAKQEVRAWPFIGWLTSAAEVIFIQRWSGRDARRVLELVGERLDRGDGVALFPEGTSTDGAEVVPFHGALLLPAVTRGMPIHYASLDYRTPPDGPPASEAVCFTGEAGFFAHLLALLGLPWVEVRVRFGPTPVKAANRRDAAARLHEAVVAGRMTA